MNNSAMLPKSVDVLRFAQLGESESLEHSQCHVVCFEEINLSNMSINNVFG